MDTSESSTQYDPDDDARPAEPAHKPAHVTADAPRRGWRRWAMDTRPLRRPAYRRLWTSTIVTSVGSQLTAVAVPKQIYDITGSSAWVGCASLAGLVPMVVFALWGGAVADTMDRHGGLGLRHPSGRHGRRSAGGRPHAGPGRRRAGAAALPDLRPAAATGPARQGMLRRRDA